ncbi:TRAP dicarboxylate transporter, DctM subunit [Spirochaeta thermophila DSM 6578]|uniref:TRAP dicarboxylate transporter, DctM subunit n=1 Tax=Winmispira thermophila (strain ATCC 700085 / DSM 6578 / Z-1203) TaxID=869211 RepID=G0GEI3_WINT7|nr:TRAP transporter large permease subunit [Spirochaeta thermophila]AEJ60671.1 TRAP dicarboxylate transporter, DctM subunit [Spirochaeta thermophila DSM 6578]
MLLVAILFLLFLLMGMPVAFAIGISGVAFFLQHSELPFSMIVQLPISQTQNFPLLAVPLFIFAGNIMNSAGVTQRLIKLSTLLTGHMRGGLAQVSVVLSTLMGGVSGSATADAAMEARLLGPGMLERGYSKGYIAAVIGYTSLITATVPPGVGIIIYGTTGEVSIGQLFAAGLMVGLIMMVALMITVAITARVRGYKPERERRASLKEIFSSLGETIWALIFPILLLVGLRMGIYTPSEVGAFACVYGIFVGVFVYKELTWKKFLETLRTTANDVGAVMYIIALSGIFRYGIPFEHIPQALTSLITGFTSNVHLLLILVVVFLIFVGMFMEGSVAILLFTPILLPMVQAFGVDPVHFGLVMCTTITMGLLTPPVGISMYALSSILEMPISEYIKEMWPFLGAVVAVILFMIFFPDVVLFLPRLLFG